MKKTKITFCLIAASALVLSFWLGAPSAQAQTITYANGGAGIYEPYSSIVSATDAANVGSSVLSSLSLTAGSAIYGSSAAMLNDGLVFDPTTYGTSDRGNTAFSLTPSDGSQVTIAFNTSLYLTSINTFAMSGGGQLRSAQDYGLEYYSGGTWTSLFSNLNTSDPNNIDAGNSTTWVNLDFTGFGGGSLANVDALRFSFHNVDGDETMYRELDVMAQPVPEPASFAMLLCGAGLLLVLRRRQ